MSQHDWKIADLDIKHQDKQKNFESWICCMSINNTCFKIKNFSLKKKQGHICQSGINYLHAW